LMLLDVRPTYVRDVIKPRRNVHRRVFFVEDLDGF
jgi:hypothetical protein